MDDPKILVVYYSRTGSTKKVGEVLARELQCDVEELADTQDRLGIIGYLRSAFDALLGRTTLLGRTDKDPGAYDLVVIGTPIWVGTVSTPIRTYLSLYKERMKNVAFFACNSPGARVEGAFEAMKTLSGKAPLRRLAIDEDKVARGAHLQELAHFAQELSTLMANLPPEQLPLRPVSPPPEGLSEELRH